MDIALGIELYPKNARSSLIFTVLIKFILIILISSGHFCLISVHLYLFNFARQCYFDRFQLQL